MDALLHRPFPCPCLSRRRLVGPSPMGGLLRQPPIGCHVPCANPKVERMALGGSFYDPPPGGSRPPTPTLSPAGARGGTPRRAGGGVGGGGRSPPAVPARVPFRRDVRGWAQPSRSARRGGSGARPRGSRREVGGAVPERPSGVPGAFPGRVQGGAMAGILRSKI